MIACMENHTMDHGPWTMDKTVEKKLPLKQQHKSRFLVTGGAGFIGSHIVERLLKDGHFVRVLDNFSSGKEENLSFVLEPYAESRKLKAESFELIRGDIRDYSTCLNACDGIDYVLHQAALKSVPESIKKPLKYNEVNIDSTVNMLNAAKEKGVKRFVFASSCSVYGEAKSFPQKEEDTSYLISPYALTKLTAEHYCRIYSINHGLETVCLRYFNVFGPKQSLDDDYASVIPKFINCMLDNEKPPIHGTGRQSRDFVYIDDVVNANILAAITNIRDTKPVYDVINIASGADHSILQLVDTLNNVMNKRIVPKFTPKRSGDVFKALGDISKAKEMLEYAPSVNFEEGLKKTVKWFDSERLISFVR